MAQQGPDSLQIIGYARTPYRDEAPRQPDPLGGGRHSIMVEPEYAGGLRGLEHFSFVYVISWLHRGNRSDLRVVLPWDPDSNVGLFASRSPNRINPIGLSVVRILAIEGARLVVSGLDLFDGTPILDLKPYIKDLDSKSDANVGWLDDPASAEHLAMHIRGIAHTH
jgi:tRNA (adenine37-N6)-methyltransferase